MKSKVGVVRMQPSPTVAASTLEGGDWFMWKERLYQCVDPGDFMRCMEAGVDGCVTHKGPNTLGGATQVELVDVVIHVHRITQ